MRNLLAVCVLVGCGSSTPTATPKTPDKPTAAETLAADTPKTTATGNKFVAPKGWSVSVRGTATILEAPEGGSWMAIVDLTEPKDADTAVAAAFAAYKPDLKLTLKLKTKSADRDGWTDKWDYRYRIPPNAKRLLVADVRRANGVWTVTILDMADAVVGKRGSQVWLVFDKLLPKGHERESFAGKKAHKLDANRLAALSKFIEDAQKHTRVPGVALGIVQDGKVVFADGFGLRKLGNPEKVDGDTKFMIASNTKALATLMLAKLVDAKKMTWTTPVTKLLPSFKLGNADTTSKVLVKHLICACTGMPRQDMEWIFEYGAMTPASVMELLGTMQPTSKFGALFQYSNTMAAAAGFVGGYVAHPKLELGAAYDKAMQDLVFTPLGMTTTTHDFVKAQTGNFASPHSHDIDGKVQLALGTVNEAVIPVRPAGGAWSSVRDMLKYIQMELSQGMLPNGTRYISKDALFARRKAQVASGGTSTYGMGLTVDTTWGVEVVHHGGDMIGFHSDMMWLPQHNVGAVILTNGDPGWQIRSFFQRKLLEVLFDGQPLADARSAASAKNYFKSVASDRKRYTVPAAPAIVGKLAAQYSNAALGEIKVQKKGDATVFDFGEYASAVATKKNKDGTHSFVTIVPGLSGIEFVVGNADGKRTLTTRDRQHEYVFVEK